MKITAQNKHREEAEKEKRKKKKRKEKENLKKNKEKRKKEKKKEGEKEPCKLCRLEVVGIRTCRGPAEQLSGTRSRRQDVKEKQRD